MHELHPAGLLLIVSAPSGAGKTTVCEGVLALNPNCIRAVTCTTRAPREGEKDGVDYYFLEAADFLKRVQAGNFLEHATVYGNSYGTLKSEILAKLRQGRDVLLSVDVQGASAIRERGRTDPELQKSLVTIFIAPASIAVLEDRLRKRNTDSEQAIQKRLGVAKQELSHWKHFDYLVLSETIERDLERVQAIITAEKLRQFRARLPDYGSAQTA